LLAFLAGLGQPVSAQESASRSVVSGDYFDIPMKKKVVDFGPSPYYPGGNVRIKLSCYFYPSFMVKEYDEGQEGAEWLAIVSFEEGITPACTQSHLVGERYQIPGMGRIFQRGQGKPSVLS
jgi:hypothetical protein